MIEDVIPAVLRVFARAAQGVMWAIHSLWPYEWPFGDDEENDELEAEASSDNG